MAEEFFSVSKFREQLNGGAKSNLFRCEIFPSSDVLALDGLPETLGPDGTFSFLCRSAAIPSYTLGVIEVPFRGRRIKVPGDRTFADWTVTVINDEGQKMRKAFKNWMNYINAFDGEEVIRANNGNYRCTIRINHLRADGTISRVYDLYDAFPTDIGAIDLNYDTTDVIQDFTATFQYHFMEAGTTSEAGSDAPLPERSLT